MYRTISKHEPQIRSSNFKTEVQTSNPRSSNLKVYEYTPQDALDTAADWKMLADNGGRMTFPEAIALTQSRPDIVLWSPETRQVVMVELTVP